MESNIENTTGVPQDSVLRTLLFLVCINDVRMSNKVFGVLMYVDDTTYIANVIHHDITLNSELDCISNFSNYVLQYIDLLWYHFNYCLTV